MGPTVPGGIFLGQSKVCFFAFAVSRFSVSRTQAMTVFLKSVQACRFENPGPTMINVSIRGFLIEAYIRVQA